MLTGGAWLEADAHTCRDRRQTPLTRPETRVGGQPGSRDQLGVDVADAGSCETLPIDEAQDLLVGGHRGLGKPLQKADHLAATTEVAQAEIPSDPRMAEDGSALKKPAECRVAGAKVVDPDRGVDQDHRDADRRRGISVNFGSLPPSRASRRALSRSMRA